MRAAVPHMMRDLLANVEVPEHIRDCAHSRLIYELDRADRIVHGTARG
jgi:hypothetical protein